MRKREMKKERGRQNHGRVGTDAAEEDDERNSLESMVDNVMEHRKTAYINLFCFI